jgi:hypothetical protein
MEKETKNKLKYKNLSTEIYRMWNMKCFVTPIITGVAGIVTKGLEKNIYKIRAKHSIDSL